MWTVENRGSYDRGGLRYPSDVTDDEWAHIAPLIPPAKRGGRKRNVDVRDVVNGLMYILSTGCQWRAIPKDLPPRSTLFGYFELWDYDGTLDRIHHSLYVKCREAIGREASPTACVIDLSECKRRGKRGACIDPSGYDAGKKIKGKKCHILVDTVGLLLHAIVHPANIQDPRWRRSGPRNLVRQVSVSEETLCRRRIPGAGIRPRAEENLAPLGN